MVELRSSRVCHDRREAIEAWIEQLEGSSQVTDSLLAER